MSDLPYYYYYNEGSLGLTLWRVLAGFLFKVRNRKTDKVMDIQFSFDYV